jgi:TolB-like protein
MKPRFILALTILMLAVAIVRAARSDTVTIAVYDFTDADKKAGVYGNKVTTLVTADLTMETNLIMLERADLKKALKEQAIGISGMVNSEQAAKIGELTGVKVLVSGQVIKTSANQLVIVANLVGTETGRLFAEKVEGDKANLADLTAELSKKIAQNIRDHASDFVQDTKTHDEYIDQIVKGIKGTNRPTVSLSFHFPNRQKGISSTAMSEMGNILQKAGFVVVDSKADVKPDVEIFGMVDSDVGPKEGGLFSSRTVVEVKVQQRRTGNIVIIDRQVGNAVDIGRMTARRNSQAQAVDGLAERILPLLAQ